MRITYKNKIMEEEKTPAIVKQQATQGGVDQEHKLQALGQALESQANQGA